MGKGFECVDAILLTLVPTDNVQGSDVIHLNVLGTSIIVLNSVDACVDLLDKRGASYSCRYVIRTCEQNVTSHLDAQVPTPLLFICGISYHFLGQQCEW